MRIQRFRVSAVALAILACFAATSARAADITFDMTQIAFGNVSSSLTVSGYTLLFTVTSGFLSGSATPSSTGGLSVDQNQTFTVQKTSGPSDLIFKNYRIGTIYNFTGNTLTFDLTGGTGTSTGNSISASTTFNYNGSYSLVGSQTVTYSPVNFGFNAIADKALFNTLTFTPVPEPSTYVLGTIAASVVRLAARRRSRREAKA